VPEPTERDTVFDGRLFRVEVQRWPDPDRRREVVRHPGAAGIVALTGSNDVVLVRQFREALGEHVVEIPAGILDVDGEAPQATAVRELLEETGYRASDLELLSSIHTSPGFTDERIELFMGHAERQGGPEPGVEVVTMSLAEAVSLVIDGRLSDAKTVAALLLAALRRGSVV
jgi:8-oxo-dGTP pyrophosphatase MutT (NUDIX family)